MNNTFNAVFLGLIIGLVFSLVCASKQITSKIDELRLSKYKVYYEYNIINKDTIPVDTIYVKL